MSSTMTFKGTYRYRDAATLEAALAAAAEIIDSDDPDFPSPFASGEIAADGLVIRIDIDASCPSDWYFSYEGIVEALAELAASGSVSTTINDEVPDMISAGPGEGAS